MSMRLQISTALPVLLLGLLAAPMHTAAREQAMHRVLVYEDRDGNGRRDDGEQGLAGVKVVLDERSLRTTDADGVVHFPAQGGDRIALVKPPGFALPRRENGLPDFWRAQPGDGPARDAPLARISHTTPTADADTLAVARRLSASHSSSADSTGAGLPGLPVRRSASDPSIPFNVPSSTSSPSLSPRGAPQRRLGALATERCEKCGLDLQFGLRRGDPATRFDVLVFGDPQPKSLTDVDYYRRDIVEPLIGRQSARVGLSLGDIVHDDLSLYPAINAVTARLNVPWLHVAGNHDLNRDAHDDAGSLATFTATFGPDTFAWEEGQLAFVGLDDVIYLPGQQPSYVGGLRPQQFAFLAAYLDTLPPERLVVLALHIPLFNPDPTRETFRKRDRERLFALLARFPHVLVLSAHGHVQQHYLHGVDDGWSGAQSLHEYNVGAACGGFWSGVKDAEGIPDTTMADGTPNGYALMRVDGSDYALTWHPARDAHDSQIALHAPTVLRRGAWPGVNVYANVFMAMPDARVEYRIDQGPWQPMQRVREGDPEMLARNLADDASDVLRGFDRAPQASVSSHLWRAPLPTDLALGGHRVQVRSNDRWRGEISAVAHYRLDEAAP